jgi:hypothetical protein
VCFAAINWWEPLPTKHGETGLDRQKKRPAEFGDDLPETFDRIVYETIENTRVFARRLSTNDRADTICAMLLAAVARTGTCDRYPTNRRSTRKQPPTVRTPLEFVFHEP